MVADAPSSEMGTFAATMGVADSPNMFPTAAGFQYSCICSSVSTLAFPKCQPNCHPQYWPLARCWPESLDTVFRILGCIFELQLRWICDHSPEDTVLHEFGRICVYLPKTRALFGNCFPRICLCLPKTRALFGNCFPRVYLLIPFVNVAC